MMKFLAFPALVLASALPCSARADEPARRLSFAEAVATAVDGAVEVQLADRGVAAQSARVASTRALLLPRLRAEGNLFVWNEPLDVAIAEGAPGVRVRDQVTAGVSLSVVQPISGLVAGLRLLKLEKNGLAAAAADQDRARLDAGARAAEAYLRVLEVRALVEVTERSLAQVEAQLQRARALETAGVLGKVDVLRLESARDGVRQGLLRGRSGVAVAEKALVLTLALPAGTVITAYDDLGDPQAALPWSLADALALAEKERPELTAADRRADQASAGRQVAAAALFPNVYAIATYSHNEGNGPFAPKDALYAGATFQWELFEWGRTIDAIDEADRRAEQARIGAQALRDQVVFDVERRLLDVKSGFETLAVVKSGLAAAEEAQRIQSVRYAQGAATTTDVIDTETDLARARTSYTSARYAYYLALVGAARAVGQLPVVGSGTPAHP